MTYKRAIPAGLIVSLTISYAVFALVLFSALHRVDWYRGIIIGVGGMLLTTVSLIPFLWGGIAMYVLESQHLHIKGKVNKRIVDKKIPYCDIVNAFCTGYYKSAVQQIHLSFWEKGKMEYMSIPAPGFGKKKSLLERINTEIDKHDLSHIIDPQYIDMGRNSVSLKLEDCSFLEHCLLNNDLIFALVQHRNFVVLLGNCMFFTNTKVISQKPPMIKQESYIHCDLANILHLQYESVDEAINDVKWMPSKKRKVRVIDEIAYNHIYGN
ncbi:MAG: hypothetical protein FWC73_13000 [Defluviitaleaceae bacterium]|nr:hypothetical protein [Defluviitaleaceae bacterium]